MTKAAETITLSEFNTLFAGKFEYVYDHTWPRAGEDAYHLRAWSDLKQTWVMPQPGRIRVRVCVPEGTPFAEVQVSMSYVRQVQAMIDQPTLLVFKEKHEDRYYLCRNIDELGTACLDVMRDRRDQGYYKSYPVAMNKPKTIVADIDPADDELRVATHRMWERYARAEEQARRSEETEKLAEEILEKGLLTEAFWFLHDRDDNEYERMEVEYPIIPDGKAILEKNAASL